MVRAAEQDVAVIWFWRSPKGGGLWNFGGVAARHKRDENRCSEEFNQVDGMHFNQHFETVNVPVTIRLFTMSNLDLITALFSMQQKNSILKCVHFMATSRGKVRITSSLIGCFIRCTFPFGARSTKRCTVTACRSSVAMRNYLSISHAVERDLSKTTPSGFHFCTGPYIGQWHWHSMCMPLERVHQVQISQSNTEHLYQGLYWPVKMNWIGFDIYSSPVQCDFMPGVCVITWYNLS